MSLFKFRSLTSRHRCTQPTHGSRPIPPGTITGAQFIQAPSYIAFTGHFDQTKLNIRAGDAGGELDSGGQDARGNPMGGIAYSINMPSRKGTISQARMWHLFIGEWSQLKDHNLS